MNRAKLISTDPEPRAADAGEIPVVLKEMLRGGLSLLWRGFEYARDLETDGGEFAVTGDSLFQAGMSAIDLRWLIARGYVESAPKRPRSETWPRERNERTSPEEDTGSFVLTKSGAALAVQVLAAAAPALPALQGTAGPPVSNGDGRHALFIAGGPGPALVPKEQRPSWDPDRKVLLFCDWIIKQFRWSAVNQETILMAFHEEGWPSRIDDPLPCRANQDPKQRLHDTIKCLNRNHFKRVIRFNGDGTGEGIRWSFLDESERD